MARRPAFLNEAVTFDAPVQSAGTGGVVTTTWVAQLACRAEFIYSRGSEVIEAARLEGRAIYKIRIRSCAAALGITTAWRMRDTRSGSVYSIREVDGLTDRQWVYVVVEGGKAP